MNIIPFHLYNVYNGGLNTRDDPRSLPIHKSPYLRNVELRRNRVDTAPGYTTDAGTDSDTAANLGLFVARKDGEVWLLKAENGKIKKRKVVGSSPDAAWGNLKTGLNATARYEFAQAGSVVYATNGVDTVQKWDLAALPGSTADAAGVKKGTTIAYSNGRLAVNDPTDKSKIWFSDVFTGTVSVYDTTANFKYADSGEGGMIQRILDNGRNEFLIMKDSGRYTWDGVDTTTSNPKKWSSRGTVAPRSVVVLPDGAVMYADHEGVWRSIGESDVLMSDEIGPTFQALNHARLSEAAAAYYNDQYVLAAADGVSTTQNLWLVFDFQLDNDVGGWLAHDMPGTAFVDYVDANGIKQLLFGSPSANSKVYQRYHGLTSSEFNLNGAALNAIYYGKEHDFHEAAPYAAGNSKAMIKMAVSTEQKSNYDLTVGWRKDNDIDFTQTGWNLLGSGTSLWQDPAQDAWPSESAIDDSDVWEGAQKVEGLVEAFSNLQGRTFQPMFQHNAVNEPFTLYGQTVFFIPLKGFN